MFLCRFHDAPIHRNRVGAPRLFSPVIHQLWLIQWLANIDIYQVVPHIPSYLSYPRKPLVYCVAWGSNNDNHDLPNKWKFFGSFHSFPKYRRLRIWWIPRALTTSKKETTKCHMKRLQKWDFNHAGVSLNQMRSHPEIVLSVMTTSCRL